MAKRHAETQLSTTTKKAHKHTRPVGAQGLRGHIQNVDVYMPEPDHVRIDFTIFHHSDESTTRYSMTSVDSSPKKILQNYFGDSQDDSPDEEKEPQRLVPFQRALPTRKPFGLLHFRSQQRPVERREHSNPKPSHSSRLGSNGGLDARKRLLRRKFVPPRTRGPPCYARLVGSEHDGVHHELFSRKQKSQVSNPPAQRVWNGANRVTELLGGCPVLGQRNRRVFSRRHWALASF